MIRKQSVATVILTMGSLAGAAQQHQAPPPSPGSLSVTQDLSAPAGVDPGAARAQAYQQRLRAEERRKRMLADSQQLLALAGDLKAEVDRTSGDAVSMEIARKTAEAEKLARELGKLNKDLN